MGREKHWPVLLLFVMFIVGCGQADYERLVKARIEKLNQPAGGPRQRYNGETFSFMAEFPGVPAPGPNNNPTSETAESVVEGVRYTLAANRTNADLTTDQVLSAIVAIFVQQGYEESSTRQNVDVNGQSCRRVEMANDAEGLRVRIQACAVDQDGYVMSALGAELDVEIVDDFFDSFVP